MNQRNVIAGAGLAGILALVFATPVYQVANTIWSSETQGQGPVVLVLAVWLLYRRVTQRELMLSSAAISRLDLTLIATLASVAGAMVAVGRIIAVPTFEIGAIPLALGAGLLALFGRAGLKATWYPLVLLAFITPLPESTVGAITLPMKTAVSVVADQVLQFGGWPSARSGVLLFIGQYQLMVADACAGLNTLFSLEAVGLLYIELVQSPSRARNIGLAILVLPISFFANVARVVTLCLITYYFGDEVGQGFLHKFAGIFLMVCATLALITIDSLIRSVLSMRQHERT